MKGNTIIPFDHPNGDLSLCSNCLTVLHRDNETCIGCDKIIDWSSAGKEVKE